MIDFKPPFMFHTVDSIFLKFGKPIARKFAEKDKTENILFKRENQSKLVISTAIKFMKHSANFMKFFTVGVGLVAFGIFSAIIPTIFLPEKELHKYIIQYAADLSLILPYGMMSLQSTLKQFERVIIAELCIKKNDLHIIKHQSYRIHQFYKRLISPKMPKTPVHHVFALMFIFTIFRKHQDLFLITKIALSLYPIICLITFANWCFNYLMAAAIHHSDDFGKKQKQTSKEQKSVMVPDAI